MRDQKGKQLPYEQLNPTAIGIILINLVLASNQLGHKNLRGSVGYVEYNPEEDVNMDFIKDILTKKTPEVIDKWFGDPIQASKIISKRIGL
ncbi:hypothetical protein EDC32_10826 [Laceyella sacchari]|uniref:hypothetical protein n=1 Tax=Laceyella sacchari TaxID=37482 RepID=UPI000A985407|nr:hypothetical protein [Laceyella sacchari]TCW35314.1 hypothetical protein EDC32_10826 [Laceyella sacchari]